MVPHQFWFGRLYHKMFPSSALKSPTCYVPPRHLTLITLAPWTSPLSLITSLGILPLHPTPWFPWSTLSKAPVTSNWPPTAKTKNTVQGLTLILQDFILLTCLLLEILSSFGFPSALQPQQSPLTLVFLFRHFMSIFPNALNVLTFLGKLPSRFISSLCGLSLDDFVLTCRSHLDIWCQAPWISSPDLSPLALQLSGGPLNLYVLLLPEILQDRVTALEPSTWSQCSSLSGNSTI